MSVADSGRRYQSEPGGQPLVVKAHDERIFDLERHAAYLVRTCQRQVERIDELERIVGGVPRDHPVEPEPSLGPGAHDPPPPSLPR